MSYKLCPICGDWARTVGFITHHAPGCPEYDPEGDAAGIIKPLLNGIREWGADEDGVHPALYDAYNRAAIAVGEMPLPEAKP